jgi:hypothetical protein
MRTGNWMSLISDIYCADSCIKYLIHLLKTCTFSPKKGSPNGGLTLIQLAKSPIMTDYCTIGFQEREFSGRVVLFVFLKLLEVNKVVLDADLGGTSWECGGPVWW